MSDWIGDRISDCKKCGAKQVSEFGSDMFPRIKSDLKYEGTVGGNDWILVTCWQCGFQWEIDCLDIIPEKFGALRARVIKFLTTVLLTDPETGEELSMDRDPVNNDDGRSYSIVVVDKQGNPRWKHTIVTEEI